MKIESPTFLNTAFRPNLELSSPYQTTFHETNEEPFRKVVGFNLSAEINSLVNNFQKNLECGYSSEQAIQLCVSELSENLRSWGEEYPQDKPFVGIHQELKAVDGQIRLVGKSGLPIVDSILAEEREGLVKDFALQNEQFLINGQDGEFSVGFSPEGNSGLVDEQGAAIVFPDSYFYIFKKEKGQIKAVTIRTNVSREDCQSLYNRLQRKFNSSKSHPIGLFVSDDGVFDPFREVVEEILSIESQAFGGKFKAREEIYRELENYDAPFEYEALVKSYTDDLEKFLLENVNNLTSEFVQEEIKQRINQAIIKFTLAVKGEEIMSPDAKLSVQQIQRSLLYMQKFHGCAGVGMKVGKKYYMIPTLGGLRIGSSKIDSWVMGECKSCHMHTEISCNMCESCADKLS